MIVILFVSVHGHRGHGEKKPSRGRHGEGGILELHVQASDVASSEGCEEFQAGIPLVDTGIDPELDCALLGCLVDVQLKVGGVCSSK